MLFYLLFVAMESKDLMLGNLVTIGKNKVITAVVSLSFSRKEGRLINGEPEMYYEGIPIDGDILAKCGFEKVEISTRIFGYDFISELHGNKFRIYFADADKNGLRSVHLNVDDTYYPQISEIKYLHQLQNLYYCLTGKELEIKL